MQGLIGYAAEIQETVVKRTNLKKKKGGSAKKSLALSFDQEVRVARMPSGQVF